MAVLVSFCFCINDPFACVCSSSILPSTMSNASYILNNGLSIDHHRRRRHNRHDSSENRRAANGDDNDRGESITSATSTSKRQKKTNNNNNHASTHNYHSNRSTSTPNRKVSYFIFLVFLSVH